MCVMCIMCVMRVVKIPLLLTHTAHTAVLRPHYLAVVAQDEVDRYPGGMCGGVHRRAGGSAHPPKRWKGPLTCIRRTPLPCLSHMPLTSSLISHHHTPYTPHNSVGRPGQRHAHPLLLLGHLLPTALAAGYIQQRLPRA